MTVSLRRLVWPFFILIMVMAAACAPETNVPSTNPAQAASTPVVPATESTVTPVPTAIMPEVFEVRHDPPTQEVPDQPLTFAFFAHCRLGPDQPLCDTVGTLYVDMGQGFSPVSTSLDVEAGRYQHVASVPVGLTPPSSLRYYFEVRETRTGAVLRYPETGSLCRIASWAISPMTMKARCSFLDFSDSGSPLYRLDPATSAFELLGLVDVGLPSAITPGGWVIDNHRNRTVSMLDPIGADGRLLSEAAQRSAWAPPELRVLWEPEGIRFTDRAADFSFILTGPTLGSVADARRTATGYTIILSGLGSLRVLTLSTAGEIVGDEQFTVREYTVVMFGQQTHIQQNGDAYILDTNGGGVVIYPLRSRQG